MIPHKSVHIRFLLSLAIAATPLVSNAQTDSIVGPRNVEEILNTTKAAYSDPLGAARYLAPNVFSGHRELRPKVFETDSYTAVVRNFPIINATREENIVFDRFFNLQDSLQQLDEYEELYCSPEASEALMDSVRNTFRQEIAERTRTQLIEGEGFHDLMPAWMRNAILSQRIHDDLAYNLMIHHPDKIDYAYWNLPEPPRLNDDHESFRDRIVQSNISAEGATLLGSKLDIEHVNWIHNVNGGIQFSQAYLSPNWYQGGNSALALLVNFGWDVRLNQIWHPNLLLTNSISYKLGVNSTPQDLYHKYSISQDLFQWNFKFGVKAKDRWFYSFTTQFKTQLLPQYGSDSQVYKSAFMSPGDLNLGLGMTYNYQNKKKTFKFDATVAPLSYNLRTCLDRSLDPTNFNIPAGRRWHNEVGSNADLVLNWQMRSNINYKSRIFLFSDYRYFQGDWENTLSFNFSRFISTQIFWHVRYDSSTKSGIPGWNHWQVKEILSFGFAYVFASNG